ncbi:MAG: M20/M25/M40 family metallo-hydrolase [bacterium]|nr:M20/M25/M40 family metallo-hydrolase [bacterium]
MTSEEKLLKDLILIESQSNHEKDICNFIYNLLTKSGFKTIKNPVDANGFNIIAALGEPKVYLAGHLDTVSPFLDYRETKTHIFGRGACDTKGSVASMITAATNCKTKKLTNFGLIFTVGEEKDFRGARKIVASKMPLPFVVVGEPTALKVVNGHFGILVIKLSAQGKAAHSSQPQKGINAITILLEAVNSVNSLEIHPESLTSLVQISGGTADNVIPAEASAVFSFRISPADNTDYFQKIKALVSKKVTVDKTIDIKSVYTQVPEQLSFIKERLVVKYCTELSLFKNGIVLGPGDISFAHGANEQISKTELSEAVKCYSTIIENFSK